MKKIFQNVGMMLFSVLIALAMGEVVLRFFFPQKLGTIQFSHHQELGLVPVPNQKGFNLFPGVYDFTYTNDENARRITNPKPLKEGDYKKTILFLGDSFTYGIGVNDNQTFAYKLQQHLLKDSIHIVNGGTQGKGTDYALRYYQTYKDQVKPDAVVYFAHFNDVQDNYREYYYTLDKQDNLKRKAFSKSFSKRKEMLSNSKFYNWMISHSHIFSLVKSVVVSVMKPELVISYNEDFSDDFANHFTDVIMNTLTAELKTDEVEFFTYYIPHVNDLKVAKAENKLRPPEAYFKNYCETNNVAYDTFTDKLINSNKTIEELYLLEGHWTEEGHKIVADYLKNTLGNK